jgi:uncharacterized protein (TIGR03546 family)
MIFLKLIAKLIKILRSGEHPRQIAWGFILGMMLGLLSLKTLFAAPLLLVLILVNVNLSAAIVAILLFRLIAFLADPLIHGLGYWVLVQTGLEGFWTMAASLPVVPFTRFNNTLVMGGLVLSLILVIPVFWGVKRLIIGYRERYAERVQNWKLMKVIKKSTLVRLLSGVDRVGGR